MERHFSGATNPVLALPAVICDAAIHRIEADRNKRKRDGIFI
jgi:hypothetical protein